MTHAKDEALKLALEALDNLLYWDNGKPEYDEAREAITTIKQALAAPVQEPVAWREHVEQRIRTWRQRTINKSGDMLAIDDFMGQDSIDDLVDFVCDEWVEPAAQPAVQEPDADALDGDIDLFDDARAILETIVHDQPADLFRDARALIPKLRARIGMPPIINFTTPPAAAVQEGRDWSLLEATQESLREHMIEIKRLKAAQPAVPDAITDDSESPEYRTGWNDCRVEMLKGMKP
jgi:hypothetical protein